MTEDLLKVRLPSEARLEKIREVLAEDEDWRFGRVKLMTPKPKFELPAPTDEKPDHTEIETKFYAVVLVARKNFYLSDEDKEAGKEAKEKRALYILRCGRNMPELMYVSNSAILNWKRFAKEVVQNNSTYYGVVCEITAEVIKGKKYTWSKPKFAIARTLNEAEAAHILTMRELVAGRVTEYEDNAELDKYEEEALSVDRSKPVDSVDANAKSRTAEVEEDEAPVVSAKTEKAKKETKPKPEVEETAEVEEKPKPKPKPAPKDEDADADGEDEKKSPGRAGYPNLDDPDGDED
jgi:hypothetical protein